MSQASTWFDLVVGIDLHYEVVPASPTPVPFPHPFIGLVWDPVGAVVNEIISATVAAVMDTPRTTGPVLIYGRMATATGDEAKMPFGHMLIPPGVSWFPMPKVPVPGGRGPTLAPPPGDAMLVFGSKTVEMRGGKAVRLGDKALSCSDPVRLPTSFVVPVGGPQNVLVGGPEAIDWAVVAFAAGFGALRTKCVAKLAHAAINKFVPKDFRRARDFLHDAACFVTGHPVNVVNGSMFTTWVDFELPGPLPLRFSRRYRSSFCGRDSVVGYGWSHTLDQQIWIEHARVVCLTEDGRELEFDTFDLPDHVMRKNDEIFDPVSRLTLRSLGGLRWEISGPDGLTRELGPIPGESPQNRDRGLARLTRIRNRGGQAIHLRYDDHARLVEVVDSGGRLIKLEHDRNGRLGSIWLPATSGEGWRRQVELRYSPEGDLVETRDARGNPIRFAYEHHTLVKETNRNGLSFYFAYDGWGPLARCTRTWGDGGIHDHEITYDLEGRRTIVEDSLGHPTVYEWGPHGVMAKIIDARGGETCFEYDELLRRTATIDPLGNSTRYGYDERGNQVMVVGPDKAITEIHYDEHDDPIWMKTPKGAEWRWSYDRWGRRTTEINPLRQCTRYHYQHGRMVAVESAVGSRTCLSYDSAGNVTQLVNPDGTRREWSYDAVGRLASTTDPLGNVQRRQYDELGRLVRVDEPDGNVRHLEYDAEGHVVRLSDSRRRVILTYQGMGKVASRTIAGTTVGFEYDTEERLVAVINEKGHACRFERDGLGNVRAEVGFDGSRRVYVRDPAGRVTKVHRPGIGRFTAFEYDAAGRRTKVSHHDGSEAFFVYDADGALVEADNDTIDVHFERDPLGRIVRERQGEHWVASQYDYHGLRIGMKSSLGATQQILRDLMGNVTRVAAGQDDQQWEATFTRDALGLEVERRLPGSARSRWSRDRLGHPTLHSIEHEGAVHRARRYTWGDNGRLAALQDDGRRLTFEHDARGYLAATVDSSGAIDRRTFDEAGNVHRTVDGADREYGPSGELVLTRSSTSVRTYVHDPEGNLVRMDDEAGTWAYDWNGAGQLARAVHSDGREVSFAYDALGRRVAKGSDARTTRWLWDGNVPLHELEYSTTSPDAHDPAAAPPGTTWLFEPDSFAPIARLSASSVHSVVSDHLGVPLCMLDERGNARWQADTDIWGRASVVGEPELCPWRWPGQYADAETGLSYNRFRYYSPADGQYVSRDPLRLLGGIALYAYVPDPLVSTDPLGLTRQDDYSDGLSRVGTGPGEAFFWSGRTNGVGGEDIAKRIAQARGGVTLEILIDQRKIDMPAWDFSNPASMQAWKDISREYAENVSGDVRAVVGAQLRPGNVWETAELPYLIMNQNVSSISIIDPVTEVQQFIFRRRSL